MANERHAIEKEAAGEGALSMKEGSMRRGDKPTIRKALGEMVAL